MPNAGREIELFSKCVPHSPFLQICNNAYDSFFFLVTNRGLNGTVKPKCDEIEAERKLSSIYFPPLSRADTADRGRADETWHTGTAQRTAHTNTG
jgi:hypothetical protein